MLMHKALGMNVHYGSDGREPREQDDAEPGVRCTVSDPPDAMPGTNRFGREDPSLHQDAPFRQAVSGA